MQNRLQTGFTPPTLTGHPELGLSSKRPSRGAFFGYRLYNNGTASLRSIRTRTVAAARIACRGDQPVRHRFELLRQHWLEQEFEAGSAQQVECRGRGTKRAGNDSGARGPADRPRLSGFFTRRYVGDGRDAA